MICLYNIFNISFFMNNFIYGSLNNIKIDVYEIID